MNPYIASLVSLIITFFFLKRSLPYFKKYLVDKPNQRSSHNKPKPSGGGIIFVLIGSFFCFLCGNNIPLYCIPLSLIGLADDFYDLPAFLRYLAQLITALLLIFIVISSGFIGLNLHFWSYIFLYIFGIICTTAIINFTNFMDGIDGLLAGCFSIILLSASNIIDISFLPLAGSVMGFLVLNWYPSKLFMGDSGSYFIGSVYFSSMLDSTSLIEGFSLLFLAFPIYADVSITMIRRLFNKQNIFKAHKLFLFQRLHQSGLSHLDEL